MKLFVALALLAVASAAPELRSEPAKEAVKVVSAFNSVHLPDEAAPAEAPAAAEPVAVVDDAFKKPELSEPCQKSEETISVKVVELPIDEQGDFVRVQMPDFMLPDISPMMISPEVMRQLADMAAHDTINVGEANPFTYNAEPLENIEAVKVVDSPANEMNAQMEPVIVVQTNDEPSFDVPQQVQAIPIELEEYLKNPRGPLPSVIRPLPSEFLRDPPQASGYPPRREPYMRDQMRPIPREMLRVPMPPQAEGMAIEPVQVRAPYEFQDPYLRY